MRDLSAKPPGEGPVSNLVPSKGISLRDVRARVPKGTAHLNYTEVLLKSGQLHTHGNSLRELSRESSFNKIATELTH